ncbi:uncharacterized protein LOC143300160 isoform X2 [Babylonia areolata]|uniref:uncharacterized protein LOC143300160 isoform X2 n=1 Tax=Babylonia areolata TaxID=304850 RepID=UPI003FD673CC
MQLVMLPTLQTLGVPVTSVTLPGCLSGSMAVVGLPLLGCLSDRGSNPHGRKKPAVVFSALVFLAGFSLVISGCGLHTWLGPGVREAGGGQGNASVMAPTSVFPPSSTGHSYEGTADTESSPLQLDSATAVLRAAQALHGSVQSEGTAAEAAAAQDRASGPQGLTSPPEEEDSLQGPGNKDPSLPDWVTDPLGLAIPLAGVLAILGFAFIDMGNDLNNSSQKSFVLGCTRPAQHVSLLVVGVQMSALGGCVTALLGVTDLPAILAQDTVLDTVPGRALLQCGIFICLTVLCVLTTLLSAPSPSPHPHHKAALSDVTSPKHPSYGTIEEEDPETAGQRAESTSQLLVESETLPVADDALQGSSHHDDLCGHPCRLQPGRPAFSRLDLSVSDYHLASSCESRMSSDTARLLESGSVHERRSRHLSRTLHGASTEQEIRRAKMFASNSIVYYAIEDHGSVSVERDSERGGCDPEHAAELSPSRGGGRWCSRSSRRLALICISMFFMCGAWQSFNVCITDYLGKVIYHGDPDADPDSQSYAAYQQGMLTGSSGVLLLNGIYVVVNFLQKKVLTVAEEKTSLRVPALGLLPTHR